MIGRLVLLAARPQEGTGGAVGVGEPDRRRAAVSADLVEGDREILGLRRELDDDTVAGLQVDRVVDDGGGMLADAWVHTRSWGRRAQKRLSYYPGTD